MFLPPPQRIRDHNACQRTVQENPRLEHQVGTQFFLDVLRTRQLWVSNSSSSQRSRLFFYPQGHSLTTPLYLPTTTTLIHRRHSASMASQTPHPNVSTVLAQLRSLFRSPIRLLSSQSKIPRLRELHITDCTTKETSPWSATEIAPRAAHYSALSCSKS